MLCVGFSEEAISTAIAKDNIKSAVIISSVTFGIGHIINLFNGSGMGLVSNLCRIVFAVAYTLILAKTLPKSGSAQIKIKK